MFLVTHSIRKLFYLNTFYAGSRSTVVLPSKTSDDGGWKVVGLTGSKVRLRKSTTERLEYRNSFQALTEVQQDEEAELQGSKDRKVDTSSSNSLLTKIYVYNTFTFQGYKLQKQKIVQ